MIVPFNDLGRSAAALWGRSQARIGDIISSGRVVLGDQVREFERAFAEYLGGGTVRGVASGTDAIELGLRALGIGPGSRVGLAANAGYYASTALHALGADAVFLDIADGRAAPDLARVEQHLSEEAPQALIITHLYGVAVADIAGIAEACRATGTALFEDCSQSHGARRGGQMTGTFGDGAAFSFYPTKNLGALGDAGAVWARRPAIAAQVESLRQYGWHQKYVVERDGCNSRLDELQAAVLLSGLEQLDEHNERRRQIVESYVDAVPRLEFLSVDPDRDAWVGHLCVVAVDDRDTVRAELADRGVATDVHFPVPDHLQPVRAGAPICSLPNTEAAAARVLSLPSFPAMTDAEVAHVADALREVLG